MHSRWIPGLVTNQVRGQPVLFLIDDDAAGSEEGRRLLKNRGLSATSSW